MVSIEEGEQCSGDSSSPLLSRHLCGLSFHSLPSWFLSIHCVLLSSSLCLCPSLSFRKGLTTCLPAASSGSPPLLAPAAGHQLFSAPFASTFPALPPPPCSPVCPEGRGGLELPLFVGIGEPLSCTHGVDQKRRWVFRLWLSP